jgi:hypothetical protein
MRLVVLHLYSPGCVVPPYPGLLIFYPFRVIKKTNLRILNMKPEIWNLELGTWNIQSSIMNIHIQNLRIRNFLPAAGGETYNLKDRPRRVVPTYNTIRTRNLELGT